MIILLNIFIYDSYGPVCVIPVCSLYRSMNMSFWPALFLAVTLEVLPSIALPRAKPARPRPFPVTTNALMLRLRPRFPVMLNTALYWNKANQNTPFQDRESTKTSNPILQLHNPPQEPSYCISKVFLNLFTYIVEYLITTLKHTPRAATVPFWGPKGFEIPSSWAYLM